MLIDESPGPALGAGEGHNIYGHENKNKSLRTLNQSRGTVTHRRRSDGEHTQRKPPLELEVGTFSFLIKMKRIEKGGERLWRATKVSQPHFPCVCELTTRGRRRQFVKSLLD